MTKCTAKFSKCPALAKAAKCPGLAGKVRFFFLISDLTNSHCNTGLNPQQAGADARKCPSLAKVNSCPIWAKIAKCPVMADKCKASPDKCPGIAGKVISLALFICLFFLID